MPDHVPGAEAASAGVSAPKTARSASAPVLSDGRSGSATARSRRGRARSKTSSPAR
ncbi:hypothetical protein KCV87_03255 [Actinosynnema pretiosum subsp. pretiosum]|uniref:Uncharacterized protein n=1 Tax=Actinosynnema pretiosum subsp. pretiosum TaxID=103721 RepID=A0AA45L8K3_9PSEU|nr:hypothetical protein [Actinosynnema mirum]QUF05150.1 hypothetical protein KCV87_03255 [Actinosynnema pretiosum subsp. pretiosum]